MNKFFFNIIALFLISSCASYGNTEKSPKLSAKIITTLVNNQCHQKLENRQEWQFFKKTTSEATQQKWADKICTCVSEEAPKHVSLMQAATSYIDEKTNDDISEKIIKNSIGPCIKKIIFNLNS